MGYRCIGIQDATLSRDHGERLPGLGSVRNLSQLSHELTGRHRTMASMLDISQDADLRIRTPAPFRLRVMYMRSGSAPCEGHSVEIELVALDVLHHDARLVVVIGRQ